MHSFQQFPIDSVELNPFTKIGKEWALVTAGDKTKSVKFAYFVKNIVNFL